MIDLVTVPGLYKILGDLPLCRKVKQSRGWIGADSGFVMRGGGRKRGIGRKGGGVPPPAAAFFSGGGGVKIFRLIFQAWARFPGFV